MSSTPLLTRMSLSHRFGRKHEVMSSMLIAHIHCGIHSEGCADWRSEVFLMKAVPETRTGRVPSNTRVLRPCSRITLRYNRKRQHTHGGRALCEPCGLGHSDRKTGRVGMLFSTWRPFFKPSLCWMVSLYHTHQTRAQRAEEEFISSEGYCVAPPPIHSCLPFVSLYLGAPEVSDGASVLVYTWSSC